MSRLVEEVKNDCVSYLMGWPPLHHITFSWPLAKPIAIHGEHRSTTTVKKLKEGGREKQDLAFHTLCVRETPKRLGLKKSAPDPPPIFKATIKLDNGAKLHTATIRSRGPVPTIFELWRDLYIQVLVDTEELSPMLAEERVEAVWIAIQAAENEDDVGGG